ncbi:MAG: hypothetical protein EA401_06970 [Planctomycetota bacterium]|nr:MAG: hypothetical protein EA401_06970 [Planctomycetota bacterium]
MALWGKARKPEPEPEIDPAVERERLLRRQQWKQLLQHLSDNPLFRQTTFDHLFWIDPFTGKKINAPFDWLETVKEYYGHNQHWRKGRTIAMPELRLIQWRHHLAEHFWNDERFRLFSHDGTWLNPFTGQKVAGISQSGKTIDQKAIDTIAGILAKIPQAHPSRLPSLQTLMDQFPDLVSEDDGEDNEITISSEDFSLDTSTQDIPHDRADSAEDLFHGGIARIRRSPSQTPTPSPAAPPTRPRPTASSDDLPAPEASPSDHEDHDNETVSLGNVSEDSDSTGQGGGFHDAESDLEMAARVQQQMLGEIPAIANAEIALHYEACHYVGGDFYHFIELADSQWFALIGDVSGHGIQAALVVQNIIKSLHFICRQGASLNVLEIMAQLNDSIRSDLLSGQFFTCFAGIIDARHEGRIVVESVCCGHHPSIIVNPYGPIYMRSIGTKGMAVGLSSGSMMKKVTRIDTIELLPGDCLFVWTDGLSEAMSPDEEEFGDWRTRAACIAHADRPIEEQIDALMDYVFSFSQNIRHDDMSVMALRVPHPDDEYDEDEDLEDPS